MTTELELSRVSIPQRTYSYKPVPHVLLIEKVKECLYKNNLHINGSRFDANGKGAQMFGVFDLQIGDSEEKLNVGFRNSYDKSLPVGMVAGATVVVCRNMMFKGEIKALRKHTSGIYNDLDQLIETVVKSATNQFEGLISDKKRMKTKFFKKTQMAELAGRMFIHDKIINSTQLNILAREINESQNFPEETMWDFYNHNTEALKKSAPAHILPNHLKLHHYLMQSV